MSTTLKRWALWALRFTVIVVVVGAMRELGLLTPESTAVGAFALAVVGLPK